MSNYVTVSLSWTNVVHYATPPEGDSRMWHTACGLPDYNCAEVEKVENGAKICLSCLYVIEEEAGREEAEA